MACYMCTGGGQGAGGQTNVSCLNTALPVRLHISWIPTALPKSNDSSVSWSGTQRLHSPGSRWRRREGDREGGQSDGGGVKPLRDREREGENSGDAGMENSCIGLCYPEATEGF